MQLTNSELAICQTGKCKVCIRDVNLIAQAKLTRTKGNPLLWSRGSCKPCTPCYTSTRLRGYKSLFIPFWAEIM